MTERVVTFGSHGGLVGIVTEPADRAGGAARPAVIFSNIGLNHRVGPNRIYVELARGLAEAGFVTLRFDLSGFGDSEPRRDAIGDLQRATLDTREAMDFLQQRNIDTFVVLGFCSGTDSAHVIARDDPRVVGAIFIDGYAYRNRGFWLRYYTLRNLQLARWQRYFRLRLGARRQAPGHSETGEMLEVFVRESPTRDQFAGDLSTMIARSVHLLFIFTVVADNHYNYPRQFHDTFGYEHAVEVEYFSRADHVFSSEEHRARLLSRLRRWLDERFP